MAPELSGQGHPVDRRKNLCTQECLVEAVGSSQVYRPWYSTGRSEHTSRCGESITSAWLSAAFLEHVLN